MKKKKKSRRIDKRYFGTDGIRGRVGEPPITPDVCLHLGWAAGRVFANGGRRRILIGKDTRISGYMLESVLEAGLASAGVDVRLLGPMPTPAVAYLTRTLRADAGIVISGSHNPFYDNGIKFFDANGNKLPDSVELAIEAALEEPIRCVPSEAIGNAQRIGDARGRYIEFCKATVDRGFRLQGLKVALDCANGATYDVAPGVFSELGANITVSGNEPDGFNINAQCGSTYPEALRDKVRASGADVGIAFDGDGDRVIMVDEHGDVLDGDELLFIIARHRAAMGTLGGGVVGTVMSNLGLEQAIVGLGLNFRRAQVGDRYVLENLRECGWLLGGESSGHIVCLDLNTTGDGIVSALQVLVALSTQGGTMSELRHGMEKMPQCMVNVSVPDPAAVVRLGAVSAAVRAVERQLAKRGRVLLRPSGTEPVVRVMVEGEDSFSVAAHANELAETVRRAANGS
jgi:phosphoglucosamine mutase